MKNVITIPFHIGDYLKDTRGFDEKEHGAYFLLLLELYTNGGAIPHNSKRIKRICCVESPALWKRLEPVILSKCIVSDGVVTHKKVLSVLAEIKRKSELAKNNSKARWSKKGNKNKDGSMQTHSGRNANHKPKPIKIKKGDEGTPRRKLFDLVSRVENEAAWGSWFDACDVTETDIIAPSPFFAGKINQQYEKVIKISGHDVVVAKKGDAA